VIAAAAMVALDEGPGRLHEDHANAKRLAEGVAEAVPSALKVEDVETNIVFADPSSLGLTAVEMVARLKDEGVLATIVAGKVRMLTHRDVSTADIDKAVEAWRRIAAG
jgi:threonine aldolase